MLYKTYKFCIYLANRFSILFIGNIAFGITIALLEVANVFSIAPVIALLSSGEPEGITLHLISFLSKMGIQKDNIIAFILVFVFLSIMSSILLIMTNLFILKSQYIVREAFVLEVSDNILHTSMNFINQQHQGYFLNTMTREVAQVADAFTAFSRSVAPFIQACLLIALPIYLSWQTSVVTILCGFLLIAPLSLIKGRIYLWSQRDVLASNEYSKKLQEIFSNIRIISGFALESKELKSLKDKFLRLKKTSITLQFIQSTVSYTYNPIGIIIVFITYLMGSSQSLPLAELVVILLAFHRLTSVLRTLTQSFNGLVQLVPSYEHVSKLITDAKNQRPEFGLNHFNGIQKKIEFKDVSFSYPNSKKVLTKINLNICKNEMTALIGSSGAGKSTIADILLGLQRPSSGELLVDQIKMNDLSIATYKSKIGYVPQQSSLFNDTIIKNILWANPKASNDDILEACQQANANEFIKNLKDGINTIVGDRGVQLSGGQVQRIALARALIRKPSILILDEATSALDSESERLIQQSLNNLMGKITLLVIAHRLSTIKKSDNIYIIDKGEIIGSGDFDVLMKTNNYFAKLVKMQEL